MNWLVSITSASFFTNWIIISFTNWRFHQALKAQGDSLFNEVYAWKSTLWPLAPAWLMLISLMLLVCCIFAGAKPIVRSRPSQRPTSLMRPENQTEANPWKQGGGAFSAYNFFEYTIGLLIIFGFTLAYKLIFRTPWRDPRTADCTTGRRTLDTEEIIMLDEYYKLPMWKRFLTYVQLW